MRQQQEKAKDAAAKMATAAFKTNAAQGLKARGDASKKESKVVFADLVELPRSVSEAGPSVQPESPKDRIVRPSRRHSNPPAGLPPAVSDASLTPGLTSSRRTSKPPAGLPPAVSDASLTPGGGFTSANKSSSEFI